MRISACCAIQRSIIAVSGPAARAEIPARRARSNTNRNIPDQKTRAVAGCKTIPPHHLLRMVYLMLSIAGIYVSPGITFSAATISGLAHPTISVPEVECIAGKGLVGDRFFNCKDHYLGQVTFFAWETYVDLCAQFGVTDKDPGVFRRNVITKGADLNELIGKEFEIHGVQFHGTQESSPCEWMDTAFAAGAMKAMQGRRACARASSPTVCCAWTRTFHEALCRSPGRGTVPPHGPGQGIFADRGRAALAQAGRRKLRASGRRRCSSRSTTRPRSSEPAIARSSTRREHAAHLQALPAPCVPPAILHLLTLAVDLPAMTPGYLHSLITRLTTATGVVPMAEGFFQGYGRDLSARDSASRRGRARQPGSFVCRTFSERPSPKT